MEKNDGMVESSLMIHAVDMLLDDCFQSVHYWTSTFYSR